MTEGKKRGGRGKGQGGREGGRRGGEEGGRMGRVGQEGEDGGREGRVAGRTGCGIGIKYWNTAHLEAGASFFRGDRSQRRLLFGSVTSLDPTVVMH